MIFKRVPVDYALWAALPMAHTSKVEERITMILDTTRRRTFPRRFLLLAAAVGAAALVPLSMLRPAVQAAPLASTAQQQKAKRQALARVSAVHAVSGEFDAFQLTQRGQALTPQTVKALERQLAVQPNDYASRIRLLGYYGRKQFASAPAKAAYQQQVSWLIQNHPESVLFSGGEITVLKRDTPAAFDQDKALWLEKVAKQPKSTAVLGNAANFCLLSDEVTAEKLLRQAEALKPKSPVWPGKLGQLYRLEGEGPHPSAELVRQSSKKALAEYETAASLANETSQPNTSPDLAKTAFDAGEYDKARRYAEALLQRGQSQQPNGHDSNDDIHAANLVLGLLALRDGDTTAAERHLLAMGRVSGSPVLDSFGPNMRLAKELLAQKDNQPVLAYFDECAKFWTYQPGKVSLAAWTADVKQGKMPNFGSNLDY